MSDLMVTPDAIRGYANTSAAMAAGIATAGAFDQAATIAAAVPVFGLIGSDFLMSYAYAQANHVSSVLELAGVHAATSVAGHQGAAAYEAAESASVNDFGAVTNIP